MAVNVATDSAAAVLDASEQEVLGGEFDPNLTESEIQSAVDEFFCQKDGDAVESPSAEVPPSESVSAEDPSEIKSDPAAELEKLRSELQFWSTFESELSGVSTAVEKAAAEVMRCESIVEEAKGDLKSAREKYDQVVIELRGLTRDFANGQWRLPFEGPATGTAAPPADGMSPAEINGDLAAKLPKVIDPAVSSPVSELGKKKLREIVGADVFDNAKSIGEPIGLTDGQVETIEGDGCQTIADLEKKLREYSLFLTDLKGFGPAAQGRLSMSLTAWRKVHPMPAESGESGEQKPVTKPTIYRGDGSVVEGGVEQMAEEITKSFGDGK